ncbi:unnamed protein product [Prorocentrum cordatum]|uniref:Secreted protein n=1 Tax=Prorocentrum cordatum TaxID=2364126 RepID=A0ABN9U1Q9_9DINO|nr:unnamed protein product [Polarella glacialis]
MQRDPVCHSRLGVLGLSGGLAGGLRLLTASWFSSLGWWLFHAPEGSRHLHDENTVFDGDGGVIPRSDSPPSPLPSCPPAPGRHHRAPSGVHTGTDIGPESGAYRKRNTHKLLALRADFLDPRLGPHQGAAAGAPGAAPECRPLQLRRVPHARQSRLGEHRRRMHVFLPPRALYFEPYWCSGRRHPTGLCAVPVLCHVPALVRSSSPRFSASRSG